MPNAIQIQNVSILLLLIKERLVVDNHADQGEKQTGLEGVKALFRELCAQGNNAGSQVMQKPAPQQRLGEEEGKPHGGGGKDSQREWPLLSTAAVTEWAETSASHRCVGRSTYITLFYFILPSLITMLSIIKLNYSEEQSNKSLACSGWFLGLCFWFVFFWLVGLLAVVVFLLLGWLGFFVGFFCFFFVCFALFSFLTQQLLGPWRVSRSGLAGEVCTGSLQRSQSHRIILIGKVS